MPQGYNYQGYGPTGPAITTPTVPGGAFAPAAAPTPFNPGSLSTNDPESIPGVDLTGVQIENMNSLGGLNANDLTQQFSNSAGIAASNAYLQGLKGMAPDVGKLSMTPQYQAAVRQNAGILGARAAFQPQMRDANAQQMTALGALQQTARGNGPSAAALQQQQGLNTAQGMAAQIAAQDPARSGNSAVSQFLNMLGTQNAAASNAVNQAAMGKLGEQLNAGQAANGVAGNFTNNLISQGALNTRGVAGYANAMNDTAGAAARQSLGAQGAGLQYLSGLGNVATGGQSAMLNKLEGDNQFNGALLNGGASALGTYLRGQG